MPIWVQEGSAFRAAYDCDRHHIQRKLAEKSKERHSDPEQRQGAASRPSEGYPMPMSIGIDGNMPFFGMDEQSLLGGYFDMTVQPTMDFDLGFPNWGMAN